MSSLKQWTEGFAAKAFFRKALKRHGEPRVITLDGFGPTHAALRRMGMNNEFNYRSRRSHPDSKLSLLEQRRRTRSPEGKKPREPDALIQALLQRTVLVQTVERLGILR
jgi:hypothetical protein